MTSAPVSQNVQDCYILNQPNKLYDKYINELGICLARNNYQINYKTKCENEFNAKINELTSYDTSNFNECLKLKAQNIPISPSNPDLINKGLSGWIIVLIILIILIVFLYKKFGSKLSKILKDYYYEYYTKKKIMRNIDRLRNKRNDSVDSNDSVGSGSVGSRGSADSNSTGSGESF